LREHERKIKKVLMIGPTPFSRRHFLNFRIAPGLATLIPPYSVIGRELQQKIRIVFSDCGGGICSPAPPVTDVHKHFIRVGPLFGKKPLRIVPERRDITSDKPT